MKREYVDFATPSSGGFPFPNLRHAFTRKENGKLTLYMFNGTNKFGMPWFNEYLGDCPLKRWREAEPHVMVKFHELMKKSRLEVLPIKWKKLMTMDYLLGYALVPLLKRLNTCHDSEVDATISDWRRDMDIEGTNVVGFAGRQIVYDHQEKAASLKAI